MVVSHYRASLMGYAIRYYVIGMVNAKDIAVKLLELDRPPLTPAEHNVGVTAYTWMYKNHPDNDLIKSDGLPDLPPFADLSSMAASAAVIYMSALGKYLAEELGTDSLVEQASVFIGEPGQHVLIKARFVDKKTVHGYYAMSTLVCFRDEKNNLIKVFAHPALADKLQKNQYYLMQGVVSKHQIYKNSGVKETILRHVIVDTDLSPKITVAMTAM